MAAGRGQRMMPATHYLPKAMLPFFQSTLVATGIDKIRPHIDNIHVTVGYKGSMVAELTSGSGDFGDIWTELIEQRQMYVSRVEPEKWYSIDTLEHLERCAERMGSTAA